MSQGPLPPTGPLPAGLDLGGSWGFRFEEGKSIEETAGASFAATDTMVVPGCYDTMPQWLLKRGTGLYRRTFTLGRPVENAWLVVDGMGLRGRFALLRGTGIVRDEHRPDAPAIRGRSEIGK